MKYVRAAAPQTALGSLGRFAVVKATLALIVALTCALAVTESAWAAPDSRPSVLIIDSGLGDLDSLQRYWLGETTEEVAATNNMVLTSTETPLWWTASNATGNAPRTFLLGSTTAGIPLTVETITWALDQIKEAGAQPKTFITVFGTPGLVVREYLEDLSVPSQSQRADIVGVAFAGTPHNGYSVISSYPELNMWDTMAQAAGVSKADITPGSDYLTKLATGTFPKTTKNLTISGSVGDLGFGFTDGAGVAADYVLSDSVAVQLLSEDAMAVSAQNINLTGQWSPFTDKLNNPGRLVDAELTKRISAMKCYAISEEVQTKICNFYQTWFAQAAPITHIANVLALDLSGSMVEEIVPGTDKISGAKSAAREYLRAVQAYASMPYSAPMSVATIGFSTNLTNVGEGYDDAARQAISNIEVRPHDETNIGIALEDALAKLQATPSLADKRILLLSDGASTEGLSNEEMLAGPIQQAKNAGIAIDTLGFGDVGESNATFLAQAAEATGGTYYQASDVYELEVNFMRSYYRSLGLDLIDEELANGATKTISLGAIDSTIAALNVGVLGKNFVPSVSLMADGQAVDPTLYTTQEENGFISLQCTGLPTGEYSLSITGGEDAAHVFAVKQKGISQAKAFLGEQVDNSMLFLAITGIAAALAIIGVVIFSLRKGSKKA